MTLQWDDFALPHCPTALGWAECPIASHFASRIVGCMAVIQPSPMG